MKSTFLNEFRSPGSPWRGKPFWAWNGALTPDELRKQIRHMHRMGLGGFFMHSRVGLDTPYLSDEWFECVDACIDEAEKLDMEAWLYDEDRWPSGAAGGLVTKNPKYRMRWLCVRVTDRAAEFRWSQNVLAAFAAQLDGSTATGLRRLPRGKRPTLKKGERLVSFSAQTQNPSSWYNGQTYLDTMNHEGVREFIKVTHETYRKRCGKHFGKRVPGIFTDEPNHGGKLGGHNASSDNLSLPWTDKLPDVFRKRYGYDLLPHLMELVFDVDGETVSQPRYHYNDCTTFLFVDAFARQIGEWCDKYGLAHTGHVLAEETLASQAHVVGSAMRFYEYMQAPGMDILTEHNREYDTAKQVSSVARQFGRQWRLTETYGCTGWDFPFAGHKAIGDWQAALGINLRCQHLSWYTMLGQAKRDYPAGIFYQSPWWEMYSKVEDYFARVHVAMSKGVEVRDLLVIHPVESMWLNIRAGWQKDEHVHAMNNSLREVRDSLLSANIDFDYGEEEILSRHGSVKTSGGQATLKVNKASYKAVLVPSMTTMRKSTLDLLTRFRKTGGQVVFAGEIPSHVEAESSGSVHDFAKTCDTAPSRGAKLATAVEESCRRVSILDAKDRQIQPALHLLREDKDAYYLFVCNTGHEWKGEPMVRDRALAFPNVRIIGFPDCAGAPIELDPDSGERFLADADRSSAGWTIRTSLPALGSRLFVIPKQKSRASVPVRPQMKDVRRTPIRKRTWQITRSEPNVLVLDRPALRMGSKKKYEPEEALRVDRTVRDALGIPMRGGQMVQPWAQEKKKNGAATPVELRYTFNAETIPAGPCRLALEDPGRYRITLNGHALDPDSENGWWVDRSLHTVPVDPSLLHVGENELILACEYDANHPGFEIVYLLGDFGVLLSGTTATLTDSPTTLKLGDWVMQGLPFYSGNLSYRATVDIKRKKGERAILQVPDFRGVAVRVLVNGQGAGMIGWQPQEVDITDCLSDDSADIVIEIAGHRRNSHGPLHHAESWPRWTGPGEFTTTGDNWVDTYNLVPCGLMAPPAIVIRRRVS